MQPEQQLSTTGREGDASDELTVQSLTARISTITTNTSALIDIS